MLDNAAVACPASYSELCAEVSKARTFTTFLMPPPTTIFLPDVTLWAFPTPLTPGCDGNTCAGSRIRFGAASRAGHSPGCRKQKCPECTHRQEGEEVACDLGSLWQALSTFGLFGAPFLSCFHFTAMEMCATQSAARDSLVRAPSTSERRLLITGASGVWRDASRVM